MSFIFKYGMETKNTVTKAKTRFEWHFFSIIFFVIRRFYHSEYHLNTPLIDSERKPIKKSSNNLVKYQLKMF